MIPDKKPAEIPKPRTAQELRQAALELQMKREKEETVLGVVVKRKFWSRDP